MATVTSPATTAKSSSIAPSFINALISIGATLGSAFIANPAIAGLIELAANSTEQIITSVQAAKSEAATTGNASALVVPIFISVLQAAIAAALAENKISAKDAKTLSDAIAAVGTEDAIAKTIVDYTSIGAIATV